MSVLKNQNLKLILQNVIYHLPCQNNTWCVITELMTTCKQTSVFSGNTFTNRENYFKLKTRTADDVTLRQFRSISIIFNINTAKIYLFEVKNRNTRKRDKIYSKLTIKTLERRHWSRKGVFIVNFKQVNINWEMSAKTIKPFVHNVEKWWNVI